MGSTGRTLTAASAGDATRQGYYRILRLSRGSNIIELAMLSVLFSIFAIFGLNVGFVIMGSQMNDAACRDAARAAAQGNNLANALNLAQASLRGHTPDGYFVSQPTLDTASFVYEDFGGATPPDTSPYVTVTTTCRVRIPAPIFFSGANVNTDGTMSFRKTYTFPIVKTTLYL